MHSELCSNEQFKELPEYLIKEIKAVEKLAFASPTSNEKLSSNIIKCLKKQIRYNNRNITVSNRGTYRYVLNNDENDDDDEDEDDDNDDEEFNNNARESDEDARNRYEHDQLLELLASNNLSSTVLSNLPSEAASKRDRLISYAHPLIVVDYERLEECYDRLKEIINENQIEFDDVRLVKSIITNEYDLNRVLLNDVFTID